ncbi:hypothetical protein Lser_V15G27084 [Lactuca serriola]
MIGFRVKLISKIVIDCQRDFKEKKTASVVGELEAKLSASKS